MTTIWGRRKAQAARFVWIEKDFPGSRDSPGRGKGARPAKFIDAPAGLNGLLRGSAAEAV